MFFVPTIQRIVMTAEQFLRQMEVGKGRTADEEAGHKDHELSSTEAVALERQAIRRRTDVLARAVSSGAVAAHSPPGRDYWR